MRGIFEKRKPPLFSEVFVTVWIVAFLRTQSALPVAGSLLFLCAAGCQAILGIDSTTFEDETDASTSDASTNDSASSDASTDSPIAVDAGPQVTVAFSPPRIFVRQANTADVSVTITRNGFAGAVTLALSDVADAAVTPTGGPDSGAGGAGLAAQMLTIPAGSNTGTLHIFAANDAPQGLTALDFTMTADVTSDQRIATLVGGDPGTTDTSFGVSGAATGPLGGTANSVAVADDDSFYVGGTSGSGWLVQHYFADGSHDTAFDATMRTNLSAVAGSIRRVAVRGTSIVFGGVDGNSALSAQKYTTAGLIDSSFGASGTFASTKGSGGYYNGKLTGLAFTASGAVLISGLVTKPDPNDGFAYLIDTTGAVHTYAYSTAVAPAAIHIDTNGDIVVGGAVNYPDGGATYFVQKLDTTFADAGVATSGDPSKDLLVRDMAVSPDQELVLAALNQYVFGAAFGSFNENTLAPHLLTYVPHGSGSDDGIDAVAAQSDGKLLFSGNNGGQVLNTFVRRYNADGSIDTTFANNGSFNVPQVGMGGDTHYFYDVAVDSWGRIIIVGTDDSVGFYVTRIWP
jgi:hypothetical protein